MSGIDDYALSTWTLSGLGLDEALRMIRGAGFRKVELWADEVHFDPRLGVDAAALRRSLGSLGLEVHSVHAPFGGFGRLGAMPDAEFFGAWEARISRSLRSCAEVGSRLLVVHLLNRGSYDWGAERLAAVHGLFARLCDEAKALGVTLLLENLADGPRPGGFRCSMANVAGSFGDLGAGYCIDIGHCPLSGEDPLDSIAAAGSRLQSVHVNSNDGVRDLHLPPGEGVLDWPAIRARMRETGYRGDFVLEVAGRGDPGAQLERLAACARA